jgi:hypothetical protein
VEGPADIDAVVRSFTTKGVLQDGQATQLVWGLGKDAQGQEAARVTTTLQAQRETEFLTLAREAAADRRGARPELTNWPSGTHNGTNKEHCVG